MSNDMTPQRGYSFKDFSKNQPTRPLPGDRLDTELNRIYSALKATNEYLTRSIAPDGTLRGQFVGKDSLKPGVLDIWTQEIESRIETQLSRAEAAEKHTQQWLTQARNVLEETKQTLKATEQARSLSLSDATLAKEANLNASRSRERAERAFQALEVRAQDAQTSASSARISEDMAYRWAEKIDGPVFVPSGGDPVDDGFYSARYWSIKARQMIQNGSTLYLGPLPAQPTTGPDGTTLTPGMWYYNTSDGISYVWDGATWASIVAGGVNAFNGRQGNVLPVVGDYGNFFYTKAETYTKTEVNNSQAAQDTRLTNIEGVNSAQDASIADLDAAVLGLDTIKADITYVDAETDALQAQVDAVETALDENYYTKTEADGKYTTLAQVINALYPVGSIYISVNATNPSVPFPGTTWTPYAAGRAIVGVGNNGQSNWTVGQAVGAETHTLTTAQMPTHAHGPGNLQGNTAGAGAHGHSGGVFGFSDTVNGTPLNVDTRSGSLHRAGGVVQSVGDHAHFVQMTAGATASNGSNGAHNNIQPSIGVYMWKRET